MLGSTGFVEEIRVGKLDGGGRRGETGCKAPHGAEGHPPGPQLVTHATASFPVSFLGTPP